MKNNIMGCPHICGNKTSLGYCKTTVCINPKYNGSGTYTTNAIKPEYPNMLGIERAKEQDGGAE